MKLVFATHNINKVKEIKTLLPENFELLSLTDIGCNEPIEEYGKTLEENAWIKARFVKMKYGLDCFADDTGLEVESLNGAPGVYSARYAGEEKNANNNMDKLMNELKNKDNRSAQFKTIIALAFNGLETQFDGVVKGVIIDEKKGTAGFGYDPIFMPEESNKTFGEFSMDEKNKISHRSRAFKKLLSFLKEPKIKMNR